MVVTFVTSSSPKKCARVLDNIRLNKQRVEACQILGDITGETSHRINHPATKMWMGYSEALKVYINACRREWLKRGYTCKLEKFEIDEDNLIWPWWFTCDALHLSHICSLIRKKPDHYNNMFELNDDEKIWLDYGYMWPSDLSKSVIKKLSSNHHELFDPSKICRPIGSGAPAQYRWTLEEVREWRQDKLVNPKTGHAIKSTSKKGIYADITKAYNYYKEQKMI